MKSKISESWCLKRKFSIINFFKRLAKLHIDKYGSAISNSNGGNHRRHKLQNSFGAESVDTIVLNQIEQLDSETYDRRMLTEIYRDL